MQSDYIGLNKIYLITYLTFVSYFRPNNLLLSEFFLTLFVPVNELNALPNIIVDIRRAPSTRPCLPYDKSKQFTLHKN